MKKVNSYLVLVAFSFLCFSCNERSEYRKFIDLEDQNWAADDTLSFKLSNEVTNKSFELQVRNSTEYPFQNLWVEVTVDSLDLVRKEILLADNAGHWLGEKSGKFYLNSLPIDIPVPTDSSTIKVVHLMRTNQLNGVQSVGISID